MLPSVEARGRLPSAKAETPLTEPLKAKPSFGIVVLEGPRELKEYSLLVKDKKGSTVGAEKIVLVAVDGGFPSLRGQH